MARSGRVVRWCLVCLCLCAVCAVTWTEPAAAQPAGGATALQPLFEESPFTDVDTDDPYYLAIYDLWSLGIINGYPVGGGLYEFRPWAVVMRAQFAKMIVNSLGVPVSESDVCPFLDVEPMPGGDTLYPDNYIAAAAKWNIVRGFSATQFGPWEPVSRAQIVTMVVRALDNWSGFALENPSSDYYNEGIFADFDDPFHGFNLQLAEYNGLLNGIWLDDDGWWDPWRSASRAEVAQILDNCLLIID